jgi:hypothetical protein
MRIRTTTRRKAMIGLGGAAAAVLATASLAVGQVVLTGPDGGPHKPSSLRVQTCGANVGSTVRTQSGDSTTSATAFAPLPGATTTFTVPVEQTRCVKVLLTAESSCGPSVNVDYCYVQATLDGVPMDPNGGGFQALDSEDDTASAHAYEWVGHAGQGNHTVQIQQRVGNATTSFYIDDWTFDTQLYR